LNLLIGLAQRTGMVAPASKPVINITSSDVALVPLALVGTNNRVVRAYSTGSPSSIGVGNVTVSSNIGARLEALRRRSSTEQVDGDVNAEICALERAQYPLDGVGG
jgi:hypothetical protein